MNRMAHLWFLAVALAAAPLAAQSIRVYSEFQRLDPKGEILGVDKAPRPREILSPAVIRNAYASFHVAVDVPKNLPFSLFVGQNPENVLQPTLYKVGWTARGAAWWPDRLTPLTISADGKVADAGPLLPRQTTVAYLLDLWVPGEAPVERIRFELQLNVDQEWVIYPMEVRIQAPVLPVSLTPGSALAPLDAAADASAYEMLRSYLCGGGKREPEGPPSIRGIIRRNARQDVALARSLEAKCGKEALIPGLLGVLAPGAQPASWCLAPAFPAGHGAEGYLRVRDHLYRLADRGCAVEPEAKVTIAVTPAPK